MGKEICFWVVREILSQAALKRRVTRVPFLRFPPSSHPVLAFRGAPASFPVEEQNRQAHAFLKWSQKINSEVDEYIQNNLPKGPFVGIHLRNGIDWV